MKILIIQTAFTGDVVLATPVIEKLKKFYPAAKIDFLVRKGNENLLENNPHLHEVIVWNKKTNKFFSLLKIIKKVRINKYNIVINLQRFFSSGLITAASGAKTKKGFSKNPLSVFFTEKFRHSMSDNLHEVERNLSLINNITDDHFVQPALYPSENDFKAVASYKVDPYICIAPASVWFTKQLPKEKWIELINKSGSRVNIYLLGGMHDVKFCDEIIALIKEKKIINLAGKFTLLQTAVLMQNALMNYVNDSAPLHIASAMNAPVTAFYCSTVPSFGFGPLSSSSRIAETEANLNCRPCGLHGYNRCPEGHFMCAKGIVIKDELIKNLPHE